MSQYVSFVVQSWQCGQDGTMHWRVRCVQDEQDLHLPDASFIVRAWIDDDNQIVRGLIRHVQTGHEMQFQSSERAAEFLQAWMGGRVSGEAIQAATTGDDSGSELSISMLAGEAGE